MEDLKFINWMESGKNRQGRTVYGKIEQDLQAGKYSVEIMNNYDVSSYKGEKFLVITAPQVYNQKGTSQTQVVLGVGILFLLTFVVLSIAQGRHYKEDQYLL